MCNHHLEDFGQQIIKCNNNKRFRSEVLNKLKDNELVKLVGCYIYDGASYFDVGDGELNEVIGSELRNLWKDKDINIVFSYDDGCIFYINKEFDICSAIARHRLDSMSDRAYVTLLLNEYI